MAGNDLGQWFQSIPLITRHWFAGSIALPLIGKLGLVTPASMILSPELLFSKFQIWRPFTSLFYYPISPATGFHYLIMLYFLYSYSTRLESGQFTGRPADYLFMLLFNWLVLVVIGCIIPLYLLLDPMVMSVLYIWCQLNKDTIVSFWFGTQFKAVYLPWVLFGFNLILRGFSMSDLVGILVGHLYFFLMFKYPQDFGGARLLSTPNILYHYLPNQRGVTSGFGVPPASRARPAPEGQAGGRYNWGRGNALGNQ